MSDYRVYLMNAEGHIARAEDVDCGADQVAMRLAWSLRHEFPVEVWQGTRLVGRVPALVRSSPAPVIAPGFAARLRRFFRAEAVEA